MDDVSRVVGALHENSREGVDRKAAPVDVGQQEPRSVVAMTTSQIHAVSNDHTRKRMDVVWV